MSDRNTIEDAQIERLVRFAIELDEFESATEGRHSAQYGQSSKRFNRAWAVLPLAVAAALVFLLIPNVDPRITHVDLLRDVTRGATNDLVLSFHLDQPAYVAVVAIDHRCERWLIPFAPGSDWSRRLEGSQFMTLPAAPAPHAARGPGKTVATMIFASGQPFKNSQAILDAIPDPIISGECSTTALLRRLDDLAPQVSSKLDCLVKFKVIDANQ